MSVVNFREVLPRTFQHRFGESPSAERKFVVTLTEPVAHQLVLNTVGIFHGAAHPEYGYLVCTEGSINETDRQHAEITYRYEVPQFDGNSSEFQPNPLARADVWSFSTGGAQVPALTYYDGTGNESQRALVNSANDFFEGLTTLEAEVRATIAWNRPTFPADLAAAVTNCVNDDAYLFGDRHTWLCQGISASPQSEVVNDVRINYWSGTTELVFRASTHNILIPNVGFNCLVGGDKKPCKVKGLETGDADVAASTPQPLNSDGTQKYPPGTTQGLPDLLTRRVYREISFPTFFGLPGF